MALPESTQHSGDARNYHDLIMAQLHLNEETSNRLEVKVESLANELRNGHQQMTQAHSTASTLLNDRISSLQLGTETRLSTIETQMKGVDGSKTDNKWWISILFSFIAVGGMLLSLYLKH